MELSRGQLREKTYNRSRTSSSRPKVLTWADAAKENPPTPSTNSVKEDGMSHRTYDIPISSKNALPDDYARYDDDDERDEKVAQRTIHPRLLLPPGHR